MISMNIRKTLTFADVCRKEVITLAQLMSRRDCLARYGSDYHIGQEIEAGRLFRVEKGIFSDERYVPENAIIAHKYPQGVMTLLSAFYHYGLTDVIPDCCDLATDRDAAKIQDRRVRQHFLPGSFVSDGVVMDQEHDFPIRIYSQERLLVELLRNKSKLPFDLYKEVLLNYRKIMPQLNIQMIQDYAEASPKRNMVMQALQTEVL